MGMRLSINDDSGFEKKAVKATDDLLGLLEEHHNYNPIIGITRSQAIEIRGEPDPDTSIEVCVLPVAETKLTASGIKHVVCKHFGITHNELISARKDHKAMRPRMVAIFLTRELTPHSLPTIGRFFGHRDHTTILHSVRAIENLVSRDHPIARDVTYLREVLAS